jgi:CubicO group peptidase (beta-lactamase class C family)
MNIISDDMTHRIRMLALLILCITSGISTNYGQTLNPERAGVTTEGLDRIIQYFEQEVNEGNIPGAISLIYRNGHFAQRAAIGYDRLDVKNSMELDQIFYIQSMTKPIASVGLMMLYEEGHFDLNEKVSKYLPWFKDMNVGHVLTDSVTGVETIEYEPANSQITIVQLLTHTSGLSHGLGRNAVEQIYSQELYRKQHKNIEARANTLSRLPLVDHPGNIWFYSAAHDIVMLLVEKFSGMAANEFLRERIFNPLGMNDTGYNIKENSRSRATTLHEKNIDGVLSLSERQTTTHGHTIYGGTHGLFSTADDYMKFCLMLLNDGTFNGQRILGRKTVELMTMNHIGDKYRPGVGFGLGMYVVENPALEGLPGSVGVFGWSGAYNTYFFIDPREELVGILMMQYTPYTGYYYRKFRLMVYQAIE